MIFKVFHQVKFKILSQALVFHWNETLRYFLRFIIWDLFHCLLYKKIEGKRLIIFQQTFLIDVFWKRIRRLSLCLRSLFQYVQGAIYLRRSSLGRECALRSGFWSILGTGAAEENQLVTIGLFCFLTSDYFSTCLTRVNCFIFNLSTKKPCVCFTISLKVLWSS